MEYYWNEDKTAIGVLVSCGYGAGWSTWNDARLAYDKRIVEFWLEHSADREWMKDLFEHFFDHSYESKARKEARIFFANLGYGMPYLGGFGDIKLKWVPKGVYWRVVEYDGSESIEYLDTSKWNFVEDEHEGDC